MTTTAHEDQFTDAPEPVIQPYDTGSILRRNVADLEIALKQHAERAEAAEAELLAVREDNHSMMLEIDGLRKELVKLREQKPVVYAPSLDVRNIPKYGRMTTLKAEDEYATYIPLYAAPVPAPAVPAAPEHCKDCGMRWTDTTAHANMCVAEMLRQDTKQALAIPTQVYYPREGEPLYAGPAAPRKYHEFASAMLDAQPFITAETYGGRYIVAMRFERLDKMQDCHAALLALLQSTEVTK